MKFVIKKALSGLSERFGVLRQVLRCVEIFSARAARDPHRHAVEQARVDGVIFDFYTGSTGTTSY